MLEGRLLYVANEGTVRIDDMGGALFVPADDAEFKKLAEQHGYEYCPEDDERHGPAIRRAYDALYGIETQKENQHDFY